MTLILVFLACVFTLFALYRAAAPFLADSREQTRFEFLHDEIVEIEQLVARKSMLLQSLRSLEFEYETDKISEEDYHRFRKKFERQAVGVMKRLDEIHGGRGWEDAIADEIEKRLDIRPAWTDEAYLDEELEPDEESDGPDDVQDTDDAAEPEEDDSASVSNTVEHPLVCSNCEIELADDDLFCRKCGTPVQIEPSHDSSSPTQATG